MSTNFLSPIILAAGTTTNAPLKLQSGTNLTTAATGAVEFDGKVIYSTPVARGVSPSMMTYRLNGFLTGATSTATQKVFGVGVTLAASTAYAFQASYVLLKSAATSGASHTVSISFGGTASFSSILYQGLANRSTTVDGVATISSSTAFFGYTTGAVDVATGSGTTILVVVMFNGTLSTSLTGGGTFIPQYALSTAVTDPYSTRPCSYISVWPIGTAGSNTSVGPWA